MNYKVHTSTAFIASYDAKSGITPMKVPQDETPNGLRWGYLVALQGLNTYICRAIEYVFKALPTPWVSIRFLNPTKSSSLIECTNSLSW